MLEPLLSLKQMAVKLYFRYRSGLLELEEYLKLMKPIDEEIDKIELQSLNCCLLDTPVCEISSLKQLR